MNRLTDELIIFIDGKQVGAVIDISGVNGEINNSQQFRLGIWGTTLYPFEEKIADARYYRRALNLFDAEAMYDPATRWDLYKPVLPTLWSISVADALPDAPTNLTLDVVDSDQIDLAWNDNADNETGFKIEQSPDGSDWTQIDTVGVDAESYENTGLDPNTLYYYRVRAYNGAGDSAYTNPASATTPPEDVTLQQYLVWDGSQIRQTDYRYTALVDGVPTPDILPGIAWIYVDEDDGSLKVAFGDAVIITLSADVS